MRHVTATTLFRPATFGSAVGGGEGGGTGDTGLTRRRHRWTPPSGSAVRAAKPAHQPETRPVQASVLAELHGSVTVGAEVNIEKLEGRPVKSI